MKIGDRVRVNASVSRFNGKVGTIVSEGAAGYEWKVILDDYDFGDIGTHFWARELEPIGPVQPEPFLKAELIVDIKDLETSHLVSMMHSIATELVKRGVK